MGMDDVACGIALDTRSLEMEVLCTLPCGGNHTDYNGRRVWDRGANIVEMQRDFVVGKNEVRAALDSLAKNYAVKTGTLAPFGKLRGGHCAFIEPFGWERVQRACEAYLALCGD